MKNSIKVLIVMAAICALSFVPGQANAYKKCFFSGHLCINIKITISVSATASGTLSRTSAQLDKLADQIQAVPGKNKGSITFIMPKELAGAKIEITEIARGKNVPEFNNKNLVINKTSFITPLTGRPEVSIPVDVNN